AAASGSSTGHAAASLRTGPETLVAHHDRERPSLRVLVRAPHVAAHDAESEEIEAREEDDRDHGGGVAGRVPRVAEAPDDHRGAQDDARGEPDESERDEHLDRE